MSRRPPAPRESVVGSGQWLVETSTRGTARYCSVTRQCVLRVKGRTYRFKNVRRELCKACGERIFSLDTSRMFDEKILTRRKTKAA